VLLHKANMPPKKQPALSVEEKERTAAQVLAASEGLFSTATTMKSSTRSHHREMNPERKEYGMIPRKSRLLALTVHRPFP